MMITIIDTPLFSRAIGLQASFTGKSEEVQSRIVVQTEGESDQATTSSTGPETLTNGGMDISHRKGPAGFARLECDRLMVPMGTPTLKYPRAGALFPDFHHGRHLLLAGTVEIEWTPLVPDGLCSWSLTVKKIWRWE